MNFGIILTSGDPRTAARLAALAESSGWDGVFTWDGISIGESETFAPWVTMAAMAMTTSRVRLGAVIVPPARRRPWKLAREAMSIDVLSNGRLVLPVGLGALDDRAWGHVGEPTAARIRAEKLDETLAILDGLWSGEPFGFHGRHYAFEPMTFLPRPVQRPRIPIWPVGVWPVPRSMRRTLRWDGIVVQVRGDDAGPSTVTPDAVRDIAAYAARERPDALRGHAWDIVVDGTTRPGDAAALERVAQLAAAGATWYLEADWLQTAPGALEARVSAGPPAMR